MMCIDTINMHKQHNIYVYFNVVCVYVCDRCAMTLSSGILRTDKHDFSTHNNIDSSHSKRLKLKYTIIFFQHDSTRNEALLEQYPPQKQSTQTHTKHTKHFPR